MRLLVALLALAALIGFRLFHESDDERFFAEIAGEVADRDVVLGVPETVAA